MVQTTVNINQKSKSLPYPKLMISDKGTIVLFQDRAIGVVLLDPFSLPYRIGFHSNTWDMNNFSDYYEAITLQNNCHE